MQQCKLQFTRAPGAINLTFKVILFLSIYKPLRYSEHCSVSLPEYEINFPITKFIFHKLTIRLHTFILKYERNNDRQKVKTVIECIKCHLAFISKPFSLCENTL